MTRAESRRGPFDREIIGTSSAINRFEVGSPSSAILNRLVGWLRGFSAFRAGADVVRSGLAEGPA